MRSMILLLALAACGGGGEAENVADRLDEAAEQSDPAAAEILEDAAGEVREQDDPAAANQAMDRAGAASAAEAGATGGAQDTSPPPRVPSD